LVILSFLLALPPTPEMGIPHAVIVAEHYGGAPARSNP
jgi:hypothetical protein